MPGTAIGVDVERVSKRFAHRVKGEVYAARDVTLLAQTEVAEVREGKPGRGGSSAMPHKHNPVASVMVLANTARVPGLVASVLSAAAGHEHERAAGAWHAEWAPLRDLFVAVGSAGEWLVDCLTTLEVDRDRMRANISADVEPYLELYLR